MWHRGDRGECCFWNSIIKPSSVCLVWPQRCKILFINVLLKDKATNNGSCHTVTRTSRPAVLMFTPQISKFPQQKTPTYLCAERKTDVSKLRTPTLELGGTWGLMGLIWSLQQEQSANLHDNPQPLSELSSPETFHGFSSVPHCRLGK